MTHKSAATRLMQRAFGVSSSSPFGNSCYNTRIIHIARAVESPSSSHQGSHAFQGWTKVFSSGSSPIHQLESVLGRFNEGPSVPQSKPIVLVVSGPSGVGKDSVLNRLKERRDDLYSVVTATTRERAAMSSHSESRHQNSRLQAAKGMRCSLYLPYKGLPPAGLMLPRSEEQCDRELRNCRSLVYVFEAKCEACSGTGFVRGSSHRRGRSRLNMCLQCNGLGCVRVTTTEEPQDRDQCLILLRNQD